MKKDVNQVGFTKKGIKPRPDLKGIMVGGSPRVSKPKRVKPFKNTEASQFE